MEGLGIAGDNATGIHGPLLLLPGGGAAVVAAAPAAASIPVPKVCMEPAGVLQ